MSRSNPQARIWRAVQLKSGMVFVTCEKDATGERRSEEMTRSEAWVIAYGWIGEVKRFNRLLGVVNV